MEERIGGEKDERTKDGKDRRGKGGEEGNSGKMERRKAEEQRVDRGKGGKIKRI
jgi:hypothetical protein